MYETLDVAVFDHPEIREDAVRELVIAPMLARLGYGPVGETRVVRSKSLTHPFIRVGTRNHPVRTVPDYVLIVDGQSALCLDAKAPDESISDAEHVQQAYSYAVHPEVRADYFGLCNGRRLLVFSVRSKDPILDIVFDKFDSDWSRIERIMSPRALRQPEVMNYLDDFGIFMSRLGISEGFMMHFSEVTFQVLGRLDSSTFVVSSAIEIADRVSYCITWDVSDRHYRHLLSLLPSDVAEFLDRSLGRQPYHVATDHLIALDLEATVGVLTAGKAESFIPMVVTKVCNAKVLSIEDGEPFDNSIPREVPRLMHFIRDERGRSGRL